MTPSGKAVAVWSAFDAIRSAATTSGATWSPARDVATAPAGHALEAPQVGISDKGQAVAAWWRWIPDPFAVPANVIQAAAAD